MKQTAFWREKNGECKPCLKYSVPIFVEWLYKMQHWRLAVRCINYSWHYASEGFYLPLTIFPPPREMFYCIAWTTLFVELADPPQMNILAAAGARATLHLVHPDGGVAFLEHRITRSPKVTVSSLVFHPKHCSILFCKLQHLATFVFWYIFWNIVQWNVHRVSSR